MNHNNNLEVPGYSVEDDFFIFDGFVYDVSSRKLNKKYLKCIGQNLRIPCPVHGVLETDSFRLINDEINHNHRKNPDVEDQARFENALKRAAITKSMSFQEIYNEYSLLYPRGAARVPFNTNFAKKMKRWQTRFSPPQPSCLKHYSLILAHEEWGSLLSLKQNQVSFKFIETCDNKKSILLYDGDFINQLSEKKILQINIEPRFVPTGIGIDQVMIITTIEKNHVFPIIWIFMESNDREMLHLIFSFITLNIIPSGSIQIVLFPPKKELYTFMQVYFEKAQCKMIYFQYCESLINKTHENGFFRHNILPQNIEGKNDFFLKYLGAPLLPANKIEDFERDLYFDEIGIYFKGTFSETADFLRDVIDKFDTNYMSASDNHLCFNNCYEIFINKHLRKWESYNIWQFTRNIVGLFGEAHLNLEKLNKGKTISRFPKLSYYFDIRTVNKIYNRYSTNKISADEILKESKGMLKKLFSDFKHTLGIYEDGGAGPSGENIIAEEIVVPLDENIDIGNEAPLDGNINIGNEAPLDENNYIDDVEIVVPFYLDQNIENQENEEQGQMGMDFEREE